MPNVGIQYDKTCPKCAASGDAVRATTGLHNVVVVDLRCSQGGHTWAVNLTSRIPN